MYKFVTNKSLLRRERRYDKFVTKESLMSKRKFVDKGLLLESEGERI